ncbi:MAG: peptide ABC transporter substrate-binding protein [Nitrospirae bacterium CG18_big_fil_WC_8_21_14_2_50_70_55]|nr:ATP-binding cassette domain-containing protein [Deltaproteobacteria bacterium]OIP66052.1 MAG: peptide ABC transporter substrate-binding protein [Nitrospirae bacterium CG2_30_70_394]PIQ03622.1 MAG: peptide ABC transporter substrate-binding protein [Nitrospirae bacterium CG18_big_fil_WC_8_21_14_2_50_70_55]PIU79003.1 MAG: peptide ABC transporter substrate-binding protein [Nitrospirae bacterium CG06_land_8_20_14_3_00_70_43]PIW83785.1 MAG: peptide ABC transporter substrate-binding protein [Nitros
MGEARDPTPRTPGATPPLLEVRGLTKEFPVRSSRATLRAVDRLDLDLATGETVGLVGESGCGKSTAGRCCLRLIEPTAGTVRFAGVDLLALRGGDLRRFRRHLQYVFQDPYSSLNPRMRVAELIGEAIRVHRLRPKQQVRARIIELLDVVGLGPDALDRYPHEFSGGQRQRIGIARALAVEPRLIIADEPVSALDVSVQAQVLNLLTDLKQRFSLTYLFISHNLAVVRHISDRVAVMYLGRLVEEAPTATLFATPAHPYTRALLASEPIPDPSRRTIATPLAGEIPSGVAPPPGCCFHPRCPEALAECRHAVPTNTTLGAGHRVRCHLYARGG